MDSALTSVIASRVVRRAFERPLLFIGPSFKQLTGVEKRDGPRESKKRGRAPFHESLGYLPTVLTTRPASERPRLAKGVVRWEGGGGDTLME